MRLPLSSLRCLLYFILLIPVFLFLFLIAFIKVAIFCPFVFLIIAFGVTGVVIGLWPLHLVWTTYCIAKSKKFGVYMKGLLILALPIPIALWTVVGVVGCVVMGIFYAFIWPVMETFKAFSAEGSQNKLIRCFTDGTWSNVLRACTVVRDFADFSFYSYFSVMDELMEAKGDEKPKELKILQIPGCILAVILGVVVDVPMITLIVLFKAPIMLFKGWHRLFADLVGRSGPFLETVCVPIAGLLILLWPFAVVLAVLAGIISSLGFGCYAAVVSYQENSTKKGLLYVVASLSLFDESTNDFLYLREGSCFPRPRYRDGVDSSSPLLPLKGLHEELNSIHPKHPMTRTPSEKKKSLKAKTIWENFFKGCEVTGKVLLDAGAIGLTDLQAWESSKNKIVNIGISGYTFVQCFLRSIKNGSPGFLMRDDIELTNINRPEGRVFDGLFEPMSIMKDQIKSLQLQEKEELYLYKLALYCGDAQRIEAWENGGVPPIDEIRRARLEGISRRLHGFCLALSRLPTFRRLFHEVVKALIQEAKELPVGDGTESRKEVAV